MKQAYTAISASLGSLVEAREGFRFEGVGLVVEVLAPIELVNQIESQVL